METISVILTVGSIIVVFLSVWLWILYTDPKRKIIRVIKATNNALAELGNSAQTCAAAMNKFTNAAEGWRNQRIQ